MQSYTLTITSTDNKGRFESLAATRANSPAGFCRPVYKVHRFWDRPIFAFEKPCGVLTRVTSYLYTLSL